ncbi:hypothetical protein ACWEPN_05010 [Nonomuraea wenchangensis]
MESVAGLGRTAIDYSPTRAMVDFDLPAHDHATYTYWCAEDRGLELHTYSPETMTSGRDPTLLT